MLEVCLEGVLVCPRRNPGAAPRAAKAGVAGLVHALAVDLRETGVTANAVAPGSTRSRILEQSTYLYGLESAESFADQVPIEPEEVASLIVWLLGPGAAAVTASVLPVDGGLAV